MTVNGRGYDLIKRFEGFSPKRYLCPAGKPTIGYGHVILPGERFDAEISEGFADKLLRNDAARFERRVMELVTGGANENQISALVSFAYNAGIAALRDSTLLRLFNAGDAKGAAEQFLRWTKYTDPETGEKKELPGLAARRQAEKELFEKET